MQRLHPNPSVHYLMLFMIFGVGAATLLSYTVAHARSPHPAGHAVPKCETVGRAHTVILKNSQFDTTSITASRCDELIITNNDSKIYRLAIGSHDNHAVYPGFKEKPLKPAAELSIVLSQAGRYKVHDHLHEASELSLTIRQVSKVRQ